MTRYRTQIIHEEILRLSKKGLTKQEIADKLGYTRQYIYAVLNRFQVRKNPKN